MPMLDDLDVATDTVSPGILILRTLPFDQLPQRGVYARIPGLTLPDPTQRRRPTSSAVLD